MEGLGNCKVVVPTFGFRAMHSNHEHPCVGATFGVCDF